jgi:heme/copper-type cytochrome/quinol oxidase subunit 2
MRNGYSATLLLALPFVIALIPAVVSPRRTIEIMVSRSTISPSQIDVHVGERVRLNVTSADGAHAFQITGLRLDARIRAGGATVTFDVRPTEPGIFEVESVDSGGPGDSGMRVRFVVTRHEE